MAFKRVADDFDDFKIQKKRRVNDLLLDEIPIDEAIITKNGKLACLVCNHRPVFDTSAVLSIHRQGKKHLATSKLPFTCVTYHLATSKLPFTCVTYHLTSKLPFTCVTYHLATSKLPFTCVTYHLATSKLPFTCVTYHLTSKLPFTCVTYHLTSKLPFTCVTYHLASKLPFTCVTYHLASKLPFTCATYHLANVAIKLERAKQDAELKQKREHESYLKNSDKSGTETAPLLGLTNRNKIIALKTRTSSLVEVDTTNQQKYKNLPFFQPQMQFKDFKPSLHVTSEDNKNSSDQTTTTEQSCSSSKNTVQVKSVDTLDNNLSQNRVHSQGSQLLNTGALSSPCASPSKKLRAEYLVRMRQQGWIMGNDGKWRRDQDAEFDSDEEEPPHPPNV
ncbi:predicted protein [Nematostella vectensis]|uniref:Sodium channel modifier 1 n=1 Tax=Nematostella vectensis TaxID=45351 RepID=A7RPM3_NEMVE|nr:predicted protein [Nematostella vectensis]|eukprot:XP_001638597.1 predicted protein [Nematostella vectensis]